MFKQLKNLDSAFKFVRLITILVVISSLLICCYNVYTTSQAIKEGQQRVYFIANGKLLDAVAIDKIEVLSVQLQKHVEMFHYYFYNLEPDEDLIKKNINKALYLCDGRAKEEYDNLREQGYYTSVVSSNISQRVDMDSIVVNTDRSPYSFTYYGKLKIVRPTSIATRSLITNGVLRPLKLISNKNPFGFLIERWKIIDNTDLTIEKR